MLRPGGRTAPSRRAFGYAGEGTLGQATVTGETATVPFEASGEFQSTLYTLAWDGESWLITSDDDLAASPTVTPLP